VVPHWGGYFAGPQREKNGGPSVWIERFHYVGEAAKSPRTKSLVAWDDRGCGVEDPMDLQHNQKGAKLTPSVMERGRFWKIKTKGGKTFDAHFRREKKQCRLEKLVGLGGSFRHKRQRSRGGKKKTKLSGGVQS